MVESTVNSWYIFGLTNLPQVFCSRVPSIVTRHLYPQLTAGPSGVLVAKTSQRRVEAVADQLGVILAAFSCHPGITHSDPLCSLHVTVGCCEICMSVVVPTKANADMWHMHLQGTSMQ